MSLKDGKPCKKCGTSNWYNHGRCKVCSNEYNRRWSRANRDKRRVSANKWSRNNHRVRKNPNGGSYTSGEFKKLCKFHKNRCVKCHEKMHYRELTADHIVPVSMGGTSDISNIQPLCGSCNFSKKDKIADYRDRKMPKWKQANLL